MNRQIATYCLLALWAAIAASCSGIGGLKEGQTLYTGAKLELHCPEKIERESSLRDELDEVIQPEPNAKLLGMRPFLILHNMIREPEKKKGLRRTLKYRIGRPPVLLESVRPESVSRLLANRLQNLGYLHASVDFEVIHHKKHRAKVVYTAQLHHPYRLDTIQFVPDTVPPGRAIYRSGDATLLKRGDRYQLKVMQQERDRIDLRLKNKGYYYFHPDYVFVTADTTSGKNRMNLYLEAAEDVPENASKVYRLRNVHVFPEYTIGAATDTSIEYASIYNRVRYYKPAETPLFRAKALDRSIFLEPDATYTRDAHRLTLNRLMGLGVFRFADVQFQPVSDTTDLLDARIFLTPMDKKTVRAELEMVSKSNNFTGPGLSINWLNRNAFGGAELLKIDGNVGVETVIGGSGSEGISGSDLLSYQFGLNGELQIPRLILPFRVNLLTDFVPRTRVRLSTEFVNRTQFFMLHTVSSSFAYVVQTSKVVTHEITPGYITYSNLLNTTPAFDELLAANPFLANSFQEQFMIGPEYRFVFNDLVVDEIRNNTYYAGTVDLSNPGGLLGSTFSSYVRLTSDLRYYLKTGKSSSLVGRIYTGAGLPYGETQYMPFVRQFFSGGPNGIRAFRARTVGPGSFRPSSETAASGFLDQNGDLKLELNLEYRFPIISIFKGAIFADAGNIWLLNDNPAQPGGQFEASEMLNDLAVGAGVGMRMDFSFFVLRLDLAYPLRKPYQEDNNGWSRQFWRERPVFNIAVGYPF